MKIKVKRCMALSLAASMLLLSSCGQNNSISGESVSQSVSSANGVGRYIESEIQIPDGIQWSTEMTLRADGSIAFYDLALEKTYVSTDLGANWTEEIPAFLSEINEDKDYLSAVVLGNGGEYMAESMDVEALQNYDTGADIPTRYLYNDADNNVTSMELNELQASCGKMQIGEDGTPYIIDYDGVIYRIDAASAKAEMLFATKDYPNSFEVCGNYIVVTDIANVYLYDIAAGQAREDTTALCDFLLSDGISNQDYSLNYESAHFAVSPEGDALYILMKSGIYRYAIGGTAIEKMVDGNLNSIGEPSNDLLAFYVLADGSFLVQLGNGRILHYTFDADMASTPECEVVVYSLYPNDTLSQEISDFQKTHPNNYVTLNIGIPEGSGITYEDALKNLNTEIMSGNAPDIYCLDYLPIDTYVEKGILADFSGFENAWMPQEEMYESVINTYANENGMYAVPTRVFVPVLVAKEESLSQINDIDSFVAEAARQHELNPDICIMEGANEETILRDLLQYVGMDYANLEDMNKEELVAFLENAKALYEMEAEAMPQDIRDQYEQSDIMDLYGPNDMERHARSILWNTANITVGQQQFALGTIGSVNYAFATITSANMQTAGDLGISYVNGLNGEEQMYIPNVVLGISATTPNSEVACEFIASALSTPSQVVEIADGLPVNRDALLTMLNFEEEAGSPRGSYAWDNAGGPTYSYQDYVPTQEDCDQLDTMMQNLDTPVLMNEITKVTILELAPECMNGEKSAEETADEIMEKISLRLSE